MSLFVPSQREKNNRMAQIIIKKAPLNAMPDLEGGHAVNILLDDQISKPYGKKFPKINTVKTLMCQYK